MSIVHKRGDSFDQLAVLPSTFADGYFVGWTVSAQVRSSPYYNYIADLTCAWVDPVTTRTLTVRNLVTTGWPIGNALMDIQFVRTSDGYTISTDTVDVTIVHDCTYPVV